MSNVKTLVLVSYYTAPDDTFFVATSHRGNAIKAVIAHVEDVQGIENLAGVKAFRVERVDPGVKEISLP